MFQPFTKKWEYRNGLLSLTLVFTDEMNVMEYHVPIITISVIEKIEGKDNKSLYYEFESNRSFLWYLTYCNFHDDVDQYMASIGITKPCYNMKEYFDDLLSRFEFTIEYIDYLMKKSLEYSPDELSEPNIVKFIRQVISANEYAESFVSQVDTEIDWNDPSLTTIKIENQTLSRDHLKLLLFQKYMDPEQIV